MLASENDAVRAQRQAFQQQAPQIERAQHQTPQIDREQQQAPQIDRAQQQAPQIERAQQQAFQIEEGGDFRYGVGEEETLKGKIIKLSAVALCMFICASIVLAIVVFVEAAIVSSASSPMVGVLEFIEENIKTPPIADIRIGNGSQCSSGYHQVQVGVWPGTDTGCFCPSSSYHQLTRGACDNSSDYYLASKYKDNATALRSSPPKEKQLWDLTEIIIGNDDDYGYSGYYPRCHTIHSKPSRKLTTWRSHSFCVSYYASSDYKWTGKSCGAGFQRCQPGLCVKSTLECPVTSLDYSQMSYTSGGYSRTSVNLNVTRDSSQPGLLKLQVEQDGAPCLANSYKPATSDYPYYPLLSSTPSGCGKYGSDDASILLDSEPETDLYNENGLSYTVSQLPGYSYYLSGRKTSLYGRQRLEVNAKSDSCLQLETIYFKEAASGIAAIGGAVILLALFAMCCGCFSCCCAASEFQGSTQSLWDMGKKMNFLSCVGVTIVMILFTVAYVSVESAHTKIAGSSEYFKGVQNLNCFKNPQIGQALEDFADTPKTADSVGSTVMMSFSILLVLYAVYLIGFIIVSISRPN